MKLLLATIIVFFVCTVGASATSSEQPPWVDNEASTLTSSCGALRAEVIARMDYARQIHVDYVKALSLPSPPQWALAGESGASAVQDGIKWHSYWVDTYKQTIKLLKQDCASQSG